MLSDEDYEDDPFKSAMGDGEHIEENATKALDALNRGPQAGEIEQAIESVEIAADEIRRQQEALQDAVSDLSGSGYGSGGLVALANGADTAYDELEEIRGVARNMVSGLSAADSPPAAAEAEVEIDGTPYRIRLDPLEEAETGEPIDDDSE